VLDRKKPQIVEIDSYTKFVGVSQIQGYVYSRFAPQKTARLTGSRATEVC